MSLDVFRCLSMSLVGESCKASQWLLKTPTFLQLLPSKKQKNKHTCASKKHKTHQNVVKTKHINKKTCHILLHHQTCVELLKIQGIHVRFIGFSRICLGFLGLHIGRHLQQLQSLPQRGPGAGCLQLAG